MKKFNKKHNQILSEIYRRLNYFAKGNINYPLLWLAYPSEAKVIAEFGLVKPTSKESFRQLNWYSLTEKGKKFFSNYIRILTEKENLDLYNGDYVKSFDASYLSDKKYFTMQNVGSVKYLVNFHDGEKTHKDGSKFFDIETFSNKKRFNSYVKKLEKDGYTYRYV